MEVNCGVCKWWNVKGKGMCWRFPAHIPKEASDFCGEFTPKDGDDSEQGLQEDDVLGNFLKRHL